MEDIQARMKRLRGGGTPEQITNNNALNTGNSLQAKMNALRGIPQPTISQPNFVNHASMSQQGHNNIAQKQATIDNNITKPMTNYLQNGGKIDINDTASLAQLAREQGVPSQQIAQAAQNTKNQGIGGIANRIGTEIKNNNLFDDVNTSKYFEYESKLEDAKARGDAVDTAVYQNLIDRMDEDYKPKTKNWYSGKQNLQEHEQNIGTTIDILKYYEDKVLNAKTPEEVQEYLPKYQQEYKNYQNAVSRYQDAKLYNKYNGNPVLDELDILGYTGANTLSGILDETIENVHNDSEVLRGKSFDYIKPSELIKENNARKNGTIPANLQRLSLSMNALREQATRENATDDLKNLYEQIMNGTYTGTEEDIQRVLDNARDEKYKLEAKENVNTKLRQKKEEFDYNYQPSPAMKYVLENGLEQVIGMTPIYAANLVSPFLGDATMYQSAANSAYDRARENGATASQARANKTLSGLAEAGFEHLVQSSIDAGFERGGLLKPTEWAENIANPWLRTGVGVGVDVTGEGLEEVASEVTQPIIDRITYDPNAKMATVEEVWGAFTGSILPTLIMQGAGYTLQKVDTFVNKAKSNINNSNLTDLQKAELINQVENGRKEILKQIEQRKQEIDTQAKQNNQIARDTEALNLQPAQDNSQTAPQNILNNNNISIADKVTELNKQGYNIPKTTADILQTIQNQRGVTINFDANIKGNGTYNEATRTITLNPNSKKAIEFTTVHELAHDLKAGNMEDYTSLQNTVLDYARKNPNFLNAIESLDKTYKDEIGKGNYNISDEATNDILAEAIGNQEFLNSLAQEKPNLFERIYNWFKNVLFDGNKSGLTLDQRRTLNKMQQEFRNAYQKAFSGRQQNSVQNSLSEAENSNQSSFSMPENIDYADGKNHVNEALMQVFPDWQLTKDNASRYIDFFQNKHSSDYDNLPWDSNTKVLTTMIDDNFVKLTTTVENGKLWIDELYVEKQNQGAGTKVVNALKDYAKRAGLELDTNKEMSTAKGFWDKALGRDNTQYSLSEAPTQDNQGRQLSEDRKPKQFKKDIERKFEELTGDSILKAGARLAGIELRNRARENGNFVSPISGAELYGGREMEQNPYSEEAMKLYNQYQNSQKSSSYLYHATGIDRLESIIKNGITTGNKQNQEGVSSSKEIYLSATPELAESFAPIDSVTLRINPRFYDKFENFKDDWLGGEGSYSITNNIPPEMLQIKENGKWTPLLKSSYAKQSQTNTQYSLSEAKADDRTLAATHNLTEEKLRGVLELGGFPVPSIAISDVNKLTPTQFGDITVLFDKDTIDPADRRNEVYDRDVWSPTFPQVDYEIDKNRIKEAAKNIGIREDLLDYYAQSSDTYDEVIRKILDREEVLDKYMQERNLSSDLETGADKARISRENGIESYLKSELNGIYGKKGIYNGKEYLTPNGNRRSFKQLHDEYNLNNIVKALTKGKTKGGQNSDFFGGYGRTAAQLAKQFKSIEDIRDNKNRLRNYEDLKDLEGLKDRTFSDINELSRIYEANYPSLNSFFAYDNTQKAIEEFARKYSNKLTLDNFKKVLKNYNVEYGLKYEEKGNTYTINDELLNRIITDLEEMKNMPTDYFEAKPQRAVGFEEIASVLIPNDLAEDTKQQLRDRGINYVEYDPTIEGDREAKYKEAAQDVLFSKSNNTWQQFLDDTYGKWNTGTKTNFESLPSNEELQQAERDSVAEDVKTLNMEQEKPKKTRKKRLTQQERDANIQAEIENRVVEAVGDNFDKEILLKRLQEASQEADKKSNIEAKTQADEDSIITNRRIRTILDDFIHDIKQGKDIRQNQVYMAFSNPDYEVQEGNIYVETNNKITTEKPLTDIRNFKEVGNRKVNAYQYDNPEVKPFFQQEAKNMLYDLNNAIKGERTATWDDYGELHYSGVTRETVQDIADLLDGKNGVKLSYADIEKGLNAIIEDKGSENIAAAKRIEMVLDKRLREGYTDSYGTEYEPNDNYLNFLAGKDFIDPAEYDKQVQDKLIADYEAENDDGTLFSLSEEEAKEVSDYVDKIYEDNTLDEEFRDRIAKRLNAVDNYSKFEDIKQEVEDYKDKMYKGISGLEDIANLKPEDVRQREMTYKQRKDKNTTNQRKFFDNMETSPIIAEQTKNNVNATTYEQKANLDTLEEVRQKLDERGNDLVEEWKSKQKNFTSKDVALGAILIERYQQAGDWQSAARTVEKLADMGTEAGRAVQMYSIFQRLSPETMAIYQQKALDKAFEEMKQRKTGKWVEANKDKYKLTAEDTQFIYEQVEKASQAVDEETKQRELSKIENRINEKLPPEDGQTIKALRRIAMLFNPKTQIRNIMGNAVITPVNDVADFIGSKIDKLISKKTGVRTTNNPNLITKAKGFKKGIKDAITDYKTGTRTVPTGSKYEFDFGARAFNENTNSKTLNAINRKLNGINDLLSAVMSGGDRPFYEAAYQNSLEGQMKANKVTEPTQDMIDIAVNEALQRTWNDDNEYTKAVLGIRRAMNHINIHGFGLGDLIIPFAKTPANLTKAMVEYSPVGFLEAAYDFNDMRKAISRGEMTPMQQKRFVNATSKAITGSMLYLIAGMLVKSGSITGSADDDKDVKNFEQNVLGIQPYSVKVGDKTYTYSWMNPINAPLAIAADTYKMSKENASKWDIIKNAFKVAGETLVDNSFLSGIKELFSKDSISEGLIDAIESFPESLMPTFMSQIASLGDKTQRQTFEYQNDFKTISNKIKNKVPGARNTLEPQVNTFGEEIENQNTILNAFINPANVREARITDEQKALYDVYLETKDKTIFPMQAPYYTNTDNGEKKNLSSKDRVDYQKASGKYVNDIYKDLFKNDRFIGSSNEEKVKILHEIAKDGNTKGREKVGAIKEITNSNLSKLNENIESLEDAGIPLADFYIAWYAKSNHALGKTHAAQKKAIRDYTDLTSEQENVLYEIFNIK